MVFQDISSLKTFTSTIELVVSKEQDFIKFVKKGSKVKKRLFMWVHYTSVDWILTADLDKKYNFPFHIAYTELQPEITIYSNSAKKVIMIELTCPC